MQSGAFLSHGDAAGNLKVFSNWTFILFYKVEQTGHLGMRWIGSEIAHIVKDSWASIRKVEIDDEIFEVNGESFAHMGELEKIQALAQKPPYLGVALVLENVKV